MGGGSLCNYLDILNKWHVRTWRRTLSNSKSLWKPSDGSKKKSVVGDEDL
jgi:hypothetical protein